MRTYASSSGSARTWRLRSRAQRTRPRFGCRRATRCCLPADLAAWPCRRWSLAILWVTRRCCFGRICRSWSAPIQWCSHGFNGLLGLGRSAQHVRDGDGEHGASCRLRVSASSTIAEQLLPAWLASFRAAAAGRPGGPVPDVVLTAVNTDTVIARVTEDAADIGFIEGPRRPTGLRSRVIGHDRLVVVVAPGHPWARRRRGVGAAELASTPLVGREGGSGTRDTLSAALAAALGPGAAQVPAALSLSTTRRSARPSWPLPRPRSSASSPSPATWPRASSSRFTHPSWICAGPCTPSGTVPRTRRQARPAT